MRWLGALAVCAVSTTVSAQEAPVMPSTNTTKWEITAQGVGEVRLGAPLPPSLRTADLEARYFARYVADFQPDEGFRFTAPPLEVSIAPGPFAQRAETEAVEPDPAADGAAAVKAARAEAKVRAIRVMGEGPRTAAGVGVGSTLAAFQAAYPDHQLAPVPPTLGRDECAATTPALQGVVFFFPSCPAAREGGRIVRIDLQAP